MKTIFLKSLIFLTTFTATVLAQPNMDINFDKNFNLNVPYVAGEILVQHKPYVTGYGANSFNKVHGLAFKKQLQMNVLGQGKGPLQVVKVRPKDMQKKLEELNRDSSIEYAQPNYIYKALATVNDPQYSLQQWGLKNSGQTISSPTYTTNNPGTAGKDIDIERAWGIVSDCSSVTVAVIDSGINYNQEDLTGNMASGSYSCPNNTVGQYGCDFVGTGGNNPMDKSGHGTHVAGIIGGIANNSKGVTGVCQKAKILAVRVLDAVGSGTTADIVEGLNFAVGTSNGQGKAKVVNMSLGGSSKDTAFQTAITTAKSNDVILIVAAGNDNAFHYYGGTSYPCDYTDDNIVCVGAVDQKYGKATFSDHSLTHVDIFAPGTNIYSTYNAVYQEGSIMPTSATDFTNTWTTSKGWGYASCPFNPPLGTKNILQNPSNWCSASPGNIPSGFSSTYKTFDFSGYSIVTLTLGFSLKTVSMVDEFGVYYKKDGGDPSFSNKILYLEGVGEVTSVNEFDISACNTKTCSIGLQNYSANASAGERAVLIIGDYKKGNITSNAYTLMDGTSMASPMVAGIATLLRAYNPNYTYKDIRNAIKIGADYEAGLSSYVTSGNNVADAYKALLYIPETTGITVTNN